jgi:myo-inositol 2-dehydrogenase/D-chiro-inositol 1-dehydrogenase
MRFALLGDHPDGLDMARALAESGRHELAAYSGPAPGAEVLARAGLRPTRIGDIEELLADPAIEAVIVAGPLVSRADQLRRALQSERHVLCVHPADRSPDIAYEAAMLQADSGVVLLPLLPEGLHPAVCRLAELARDGEPPRLVEFERWSPDELIGSGDVEGRGRNLPGWDVLRAIGGDIGEVFALAQSEEELAPGEPVIVVGRFVDGLIWQTTYVPQQAESRWRLALVYRTGRAVLDFPDGWPGPAHLTYTDAQGQPRTDHWPAIHPWMAVVEAFEQAVADPTAGVLRWQDEQRALEMDDGARRSIARRRSSTLEYQEATEEASFKGTMTLVGCGLLWVTVMLVILSPLQPKILWLVGPIFGVFLALQVFRWVIPARPRAARQSPSPEGAVSAGAADSPAHRESIRPASRDDARPSPPR